MLELHESDLEKPCPNCNRPTAGPISSAPSGMPGISKERLIGPCPHCNGTGKVKTEAGKVLAEFIRKVTHE
jgi:hypothetical protein